MKREVSIDGRASRLTLNGNRLRYERESGETLERNFSMEPCGESSGPGIYSVLMDGRSYEVALLTGGEVRVNGRVLSVEIIDPRELRARNSAGTNHGRQRIAAPMPGKVIRVLVAEGDPIQAGQGLVVVEAMKMQNEMKSPKAGRVAEVKTREGATVAAGDVLVVIE